MAAFADEALVQVAGKVPLAEQVAAQAAAGGVPLEQALGLTVTVDAAGHRHGAPTGTAAGGSVTWTPSLADGVATPLQAEALQEDTAALRASDVERWTIWGLIGWGALFALIVLVVLLRAWRRRARRSVRPDPARLPGHDGVGHRLTGQAAVGPGERLATLAQHVLSRHRGRELDQPGHQPGPTGLVRGAQAGAVVAVEVLVEQDVVPPVLVLLEDGGAAVDRAAAVLVPGGRSR